MKSTLVLIFCHLSVSLFCQAVVEGHWNVECGASTNTAFREPASFNLRCVSPKFNISTENPYTTEDEEKHPEKYKGSRFMMELIYAPPLKVLCTGFNFQYRLLRYKRLTLEIYGGLKFFFVPGPDFVKIQYLKGGRQLWYMNVGLIAQIDLGVIAPFADFGGDKIITVGTELNFHAVFKKSQKRNKVRKKKRYLWQREA